MTARSAVTAINQKGALLVYPIHNQKEPASLWSHFHPKTKMRWEWDDRGDTRVADLWHLRQELASSRKVLYTKWYQGRATFFSSKLFTAILADLQSCNDSLGLGIEARGLLRLLEENSPLSTKQLKKLSRLEGRFLESTYTRSLKELWSRLLIVGVGEVDDGAFPSLAIASTQIFFEQLWTNAMKQPEEEANALVKKQLGEKSLFYKHYVKVRTALSRNASPGPAEMSKKIPV